MKLDIINYIDIPRDFGEKELFAYIDFCTIYRCFGDVTVLTDENCGGFKQDCCFHSVTKDFGSKYMTNVYDIVLIHDPEFIHGTHLNNYCFLTRPGIEGYLKMLQHIFKFEFKVKTIYYYRGNKTYSAYKLSVTIKGHVLKHKAILQMIRCLYEFPYNCLLIQADKISKVYPRENFINIYITLTSILYMIFDVGCTDQTMNNSGLFTKRIKSIKQFTGKFTNCDLPYDSLINNMFDYVELPNFLEQLSRTPFNKDKKRTLNFWISDDTYNYIFNIYKSLKIKTR